MKTTFCFQFKFEARLRAAQVTRAASDPPELMQGGSWVSEYLLLSGETQTFPRAGSSLSAQGVVQPQAKKQGSLLLSSVSVPTPTVKLVPFAQT